MNNLNPKPAMSIGYSGVLVTVICGADGQQTELNASTNKIQLSCRERYRIEK